MPRTVFIGGTSYNIPVTGERGWGDDTTTLLEKLSIEINEFVVGTYNLTTKDYIFNDVSGAFGVQANFYKSLGNLPSTGFLRIANPGSEAGNIFTKIVWSNALNDGDLPLFPTNDEFLEFAGVQLANISGTQTFTNKTATDLNLDNTVTGSAIITDVNLAGAADTLLASSLALKTYIDNVAEAQNDASEITYTPSTLSDWTGSVDPGNVDGGLDQLAARTTADETALSDHLLDGADAHDASAISYVNTTSTLTATDVQAAIDEVEGRVDTAESNISNKADKSTTVTAGAGLTGSGTLGANLILDVGAGQGIEAAADEVTAKVDGTTIVKNKGGNSDEIGVPDGGIDTAQLAANAVTNDKLATSGIDAGKITTGTLPAAQVSESSVTQHQGAIDHDALTNFSANEHIDHGSVSITGSGGLTGGGAIDASRSISIASGGVTNDKLGGDISADKLVAGTLNDTRLSSNVPLKNTDNDFTGENTHNKIVLGESPAVGNNASTTLAEPVNTITALTGTPTETNIETITATTTTANKYIQLENNTASSFTIVNEAPVTGNIITGTGANLTLLPDAVIILRYDGANWRVVGGSGGGTGGGLATEFYTHSTLPATLTADIRYLVDISGGNATAAMPASSALNDGKVIEVWPVNNPGGGTVTLNAAGSHNFNDPDLGSDSQYILDVGSAEFVIRDTGDLYEVRDAYWSAGFDLQEATSTTAGVVGGSNGVAVSAGKIGEHIIASCATTTNTVAANVYVDVVGASISLDTGVWMIGYDASLILEWVSGGAVLNCNLAIANSTNVVQNTTEALVSKRLGAATDNSTFSVSRSTVINVTSADTYKLQVRANLDDTTSRGRVINNSVTGGLTNNDNNSNIWAIRIA